MIMRAKQDGNIMILELEGHLDFETTQQFRDTCSALLEKNSSQRVIFNMEKLKFVGSSGINQFIRVLKDFNSLQEKPRYCRLSSEFQKVFKAYQTARNPFEIFEDEGAAVLSFETPLAPPKKISRKKVAISN